MAQLKRISMAGSDVAVTDAGLADLVLEYAMLLGRAGTTDTVAIPVVHDGVASEVDLLIGPASQIVLSESDEAPSAEVEHPAIDGLVEELQHRIDRISGRAHPAPDDEEDNDRPVFVDLGDY
jgi:hypothetical protein